MNAVCLYDIVSLTTSHCKHSYVSYVCTVVPVRCVKGNRSCKGKSKSFFRAVGAKILKVYCFFGGFENFHFVFFYRSGQNGDER